MQPISVKHTTVLSSTSTAMMPKQSLSSINSPRTGVNNSRRMSSSISSVTADKVIMKPINLHSHNHACTRSSRTRKPPWKSTSNNSSKKEHSPKKTSKNTRNGPTPKKTAAPDCYANTVRIWGQLEDTFAKSKDYKPSSKEWLTSSWNGFASPKDLATKVLPHLPTSVTHDTLLEIGDTISSYPKDFAVHSNLKRIIANRGKSISEDTGVDMSTAEALAFGSLVKEGIIFGFRDRMWRGGRFRNDMPCCMIKRRRRRMCR